jgi:hypothetical protein
MKSNNDLNNLYGWRKLFGWTFSYATSLSPSDVPQSGFKKPLESELAIVRIRAAL